MYNKNITCTQLLYIHIQSINYLFYVWGDHRKLVQRMQINFNHLEFILSISSISRSQTYEK